MRRSIFGAFLSLLLVSAPAMAHDERDYERDDNTDEVIAGVIIGGILGYAIGDNNKRHRHYRDRDYYRDDHYYNRPREDRRYRYRQPYCVTEQHFDRFGNRYVTRKCN